MAKSGGSSARGPNARTSLGNRDLVGVTAGGAQPRRHEVDRLVAHDVWRELDLDLSERTDGLGSAVGDDEIVTHRCDRSAVDLESELRAVGLHPNNRREGLGTGMSEHHLTRRQWDFTGWLVEGQLMTRQPRLDGRSGNLEGPDRAGLARPRPKRDPRPGQREARRVEVHSAELQPRGRPNRDTRQDIGEVREHHTDIGSQLDLTLDRHCPRLTGSSSPNLLPTLAGRECGAVELSRRTGAIDPFRIRTSGCYRSPP